MTSRLGSKACFPLVQKDEMRACSLQLGRAHCGSSWRPVGRGCREIFQDKEAGGWADGGGGVYTLRTAGDNEWQRLQDASFVPTKQQVMPQSVHTPDTQREPGPKQTLGRDGRPHLPFSINQPTIEDSP